MLGVEAFVALMPLMRDIISSFSGTVLRRFGVGASSLITGLVLVLVLTLPAFCGGALDVLPRFEPSWGGLIDVRADGGAVTAMPGCCGL